MNPLRDHIRALIEKNGPMPLGRYMELALQHPEYGYYRRGDPLGRKGDFVTSPEVSQMFGELIGLACAEAWKGMGRPEAFMLLELGPGRGTLMADALRATAKVQGFHAAMKLHLLETNETLRMMQKEKLNGFSPVFINDIHEILVDSTSAATEAMPTVIIANEFFDALSVRQFEQTAEGWRERMVTTDGEEMVFVLSAPDPSYHFFIPEELRLAPAGTVHEISLPAMSLMRHLAQHVVKAGGAMLMIDYGYAAPPHRGTVQAVSGHRHADVLERPGEVDLTAHVDFTALRQMAESQGAKVMGPIGQGEYLQTLGIDMRAMQLKHNAPPEQAVAVDAALKRLTNPAEMGILFKAMGVVGKGLDGVAGF
ncbi:MAG: class I SAM-dependent methyltransferase [Bdellovibrionales bacterium]